MTDPNCRVCCGTGVSEGEHGRTASCSCQAIRKQPTGLLPVRIFVERDPETNENRWYSTKGTGAEYVHAIDFERLRRALINAEEALTDLPTDQDCDGVKLAQKIIEDALVECQ